MSRMLGLLSLVVACSPSQNDPWAHQAGPPGVGRILRTLQVEALNLATPGQDVLFRVSGGVQGQPMAILKATTGPLSTGSYTDLCPTILNRNCMELPGTARSVLGFGDAAGETVIAIRVPRTVQPGDVWWFQAAAGRQAGGVLPNLSEPIFIDDFDFDGDGSPYSVDCDDDDASKFLDSDGDGICDVDDTCPGDVDSDEDGICDASDPCPFDISVDSDGDGTCDADDACPFDNPDDIDGDGICGSADACGTHSGQLESTYVDHPGWSLIRRVETPLAPSAAHFGPVDGEVYALHRDTTGAGGGLYRLGACTNWTRLAAVDRPAALLPTSDGAIYVSEDFDGDVRRYEDGSAPVWVSGWHSGDDDPVGMAEIPVGHTSGVASPGEVVTVDRGSNGADEVWRFSTAAAQGESAIHTDNGTLVDAVDVAISDDAVYIIDPAGTGDGVLYELGSGGVLTVVPTDHTFVDPLALAWDGRTSTLLVADAGSDEVWSVDPLTGVSVLFVSGMDLHLWAGIDVDVDGSRVAVTTTTEVLVFGNCDPSFGDCDGNGISDTCDLDLHPERDCDGNRQLDSCELAAGAPDCDADGVLDVCPSCPELEMVFVIDTSASMVDEGQALCDDLASVQESLNSSGIQIRTTVLSLAGQASSDFPCVQQSVDGLLGTVVPGNPAPELAVFGECPGGNEVQSEDWGRGTAMIAGRYNWQPGATRVIVPMFDEGAWCGDPTTANDTNSVTVAVDVANGHDVVVYPLTAVGSDAAVLADADVLAAGTGGRRFDSGSVSSGLFAVLEELSTEACALVWDCNGTDYPDTCEIDDGTVDDCDGDGIPDSCSAGGVADGSDDGICAP